MLFDPKPRFETVIAPIDPLDRVQRGASTEATRERFAFLKTKRKGSTWEEGDGRLYRMGPGGVTCYSLYALAAAGWFCGL